MTNTDRIDRVLAMARRGALTPEEKAVCDELEDFAVNVLSELEADRSDGFLFKIPVTLTSKDPQYPDFAVPVVIQIGQSEISICTLQIYGTAGIAPGQGAPVVIENWAGDLQVLVWDDINREEPEQVIDLEGAREEHRLPDGEESERCLSKPPQS